MIFISLFLHFLGNLLPKLILKDKYSALKNNFSWGYCISKLSGLLTTILLSVIIVMYITYREQNYNAVNSNDNNINQVSNAKGFVPDFSKRFTSRVRIVKLILIPEVKIDKNVGGFATISKINTFEGYLTLLNLCLLAVFGFNLVPLPGFNAGNFLISVVETFVKKRIKKEVLLLVKILSIVLFLIIFFYYF